MEEPENSEAWFITHDGERTGPFTMEELKAKVELHEINPRLDMAWQEGMEDWIPAGEVDGLFKKHTKAEATDKKETAKSTTTASTLDEFEYEDEPSNDYKEQEWEGMSRGGFFFFYFIFPALWWVGGFYAITKLAGVIGDGLLPIAMACVGFLPFFILIIVILKRFQNLAMSRLWFFGLFVPLLQIWLTYRLFACPPGYAEHKRLGVLGWILAVLFWLPIVGVIVLGGIVAIQDPDKYKDVIEKNRGQYEELMLKMQDMTETPEEAEAKEAEQKAEKEPSIMPIPR